MAPSGGLLSLAALRGRLAALLALLVARVGEPAHLHVVRVMLLRNAGVNAASKKKKIQKRKKKISRMVEKEKRRKEESRTYP